jgi:hypothetical protein
MWGETARDIEVIWVRTEQEYFCKWDWTRNWPDSLSGKSVGGDVQQILASRQLRTHESGTLASSCPRDVMRRRGSAHAILCDAAVIAGKQHRPRGQRHEGSNIARAVSPMLPKSRHRRRIKSGQRTMRWRRDMIETAGEFECVLGHAALKLWPDLPRDVQELLFETAVPIDATIRNRLAVFLHDRHPRTAHPPKPTQLA